VLTTCAVCGKRCEISAGPPRCAKHAIKPRGAEAKRAQRLVYRTQTSCWICGNTIGLEEPRVADHIIPRSQGGADDPTNMRLAHAACHAQRHRGR
jgi:5-methylcytosine-specific restriction endonuclease McrA